MAKPNLTETRAEITTGGIISASHISNLYDALISGSSDDKFFNGVTIASDKFAMARCSVNTSGMAIGVVSSAVGLNSFAMGYNSVTNNPGEFAIGVISQKNPEDISQFTVNIGSLGLAVDEKAYYMFGHDSVGLHVNSLTIAYIKANGIMYNSSTLDDTATSTSYFNYDSILANNTLYSESVSYSSDVTKLTFTMNLDQDNLYLKLTGQFSTYYFSTVKVLIIQCDY